MKIIIETSVDNVKKIIMGISLIAYKDWEYGAKEDEQLLKVAESIENQLNRKEDEECN